ncbi:MAG: phosphate ABC transporter permease PstA [Chloroflexota bacterium]|nr:phosphate ABC transporter permease PstA [Chloroflexota bacterium]
MSAGPRGLDQTSLIGFRSSVALRRRQRRGDVFGWIFMAATFLGVLVLAVLLVTLLLRGGGWLSWDLLTRADSRLPERAGLNIGIIGTFWVIAITGAFAFSVGVGAAIYLEEYAADTLWTRILQVNIANLAGVPSVVYGLLGLGIFVELMNMGRSVLAGALTMGLLILPVIIISSREALRAVPISLRQGAYALGATRWQVVRHHVLPAATSGILTGTILAMSRAIGETAPLLVAGAAGYIAFAPTTPLDSYTALPIQIYYWAQRPQHEFNELAAAGILVLLALLLTMNATAIILRQRASRSRW